MENSTRQFLQVKYVLGSGDLIFTPLIVSSMDGEIKQGICYLFRRKRERPGTGYLRWTTNLECTLARYFHFSLITVWILKCQIVSKIGENVAKLTLLVNTCVIHSYLFYIISISEQGPIDLSRVKMSIDY